MKSIMMAELHGALDKAEDPIAMLNQYGREMEENVARGQDALVRQIFLEKKQQALISETEALIAKRERQARLAVEQGDDNMATLALYEKSLQENQLKLYMEQFKAIQQQTESLKEKLQEFKGTSNELLHKRILLSSRANVARSIKQMQQTAISFNSESVVKGMARAEDRILLMESEVQAFSQSLQPHEPSAKGYVNSSLEELLQEELQKLKQGSSRETA